MWANTTILCFPYQYAGALLISDYFGSNDVCRATGGTREVPYVRQQYAAVWFIFLVGLNVYIIVDQFLC